MARVGEIDKALGEIGVLDGQRRFDLALRHAGVEAVVERALRDLNRVVLDRQQRLSVQAARHHVAGGGRQQGGGEQSRSQARAARDHLFLHFRWRQPLRVAHGYSSKESVAESRPDVSPNARPGPLKKA